MAGDGAGVAYGAVIPVRPRQWRYLEDVGRAAEDAGWTYVFTDEGPYAGNNDSMASSLVLAGATSRAYVGTSIAITYFRHPYLLASTSSIVQEVSGGRFVLGLGVSHPAINEALGISMKRPVSDMREYVSALHRYWEDGQNAAPIWLAALRPRMSELAGEIAEGVNFHHVPLGFFRRVLDSVHRGEESGISKTTIAAYARIVIDDDLEVARHVGRATMEPYCRLPAYQVLYAAGGYQEEMEAFRKALGRGDSEAADRAITDELLDDVLVLGPAARCREKLEQWEDAGAEVILFAPLSAASADLPALFGPLFDEFQVGNDG